MTGSGLLGCNIGVLFFLLLCLLFCFCLCFAFRHVLCGRFPFFLVIYYLYLSVITKKKTLRKESY